jgi:hypothetical protein
MSLELSDLDDFFRTKLEQVFSDWEMGIVSHIERIPHFVPKKSPQLIARYIIYSLE